MRSRPLVQSTTRIYPMPQSPTATTLLVLPAAEVPVPHSPFPHCMLPAKVPQGALSIRMTYHRRCPARAACCRDPGALSG